MDGMELAWNNNNNSVMMRPDRFESHNRYKMLGTSLRERTHITRRMSHLFMSRNDAPFSVGWSSSSS